MTGIFCALDTPDLDRAATLAKSLSAAGAGIKLGLEFFASHGPAGVVHVMQEAGKDTALFLDLKFHDIPNTVKGAVRAVLPLCPSFLTVHASGGTEMMQAALDAAAQSPKPPLVLAVTVLTHMNAQSLGAVGQGTVQEQVLRLARLAVKAGMNGLVSSPQELSLLRGEFGRDVTLVVPGIRPKGTSAGDQQRIMTPEDAVAAGADWLVIGRPVTEAADPAEVLRTIKKSIEKERLKKAI